METFLDSNNPLLPVDLAPPPSATMSHGLPKTIAGAGVTRPKTCAGSFYCTANSTIRRHMAFDLGANEYGYSSFPTTTWRPDLRFRPQLYNCS
jgi:hypothetical protein